MVIVYTGEGKGKTSAGLGLVCRALGADQRVAFIQFIKAWQVSEDAFLQTIQPQFANKLTLHKGGKGFYNAGTMSAKNVSDSEHRQAARDTYIFALDCAVSGTYDVIVCDEINNAIHDGLLSENDMEQLITTKDPATTLCLTGRNFPKKLQKHVNILTYCNKRKHHYDEGVLATKGIDF